MKLTQQKHLFKVIVLLVGLGVLISTIWLSVDQNPQAHLPETPEKVWFLECPIGYVEVCDIIVSVATIYKVNPQRMINLAWCESSLNPKAVGKVDKDDRGLFQLNRRYHAVSDECAFDPICATHYTAKLIFEGKENLWKCKF